MNSKLCLCSDERVVPYINAANGYGTGGRVSGCFAALVDRYWSGEFAAIRPELFLDMFARQVNSALADRRQHDAQEFQIYLLDALHEDTNCISKRMPFEQNYTGVKLTKDAEDYVRRSKLFSDSVVSDVFNVGSHRVLV